MPNKTDRDTKLYTVMLTGPQISLLTQALGSLELKAAQMGALEGWLQDEIATTHGVLYDVQEEWYADNGVVD